MSAVKRISLDAMGGDIGPDVVVPAAIDFLSKNSSVQLILVGIEDEINKRLQEHNYQPDDRLKVYHASEVVEMDELPSQALRKKKDSSMRVAINLVKDNQADACVSAGNTGALMATSRFVLKTLSSIDRPAIIKTIPSIEGHTHVLDLGANVDCTPEHLYQFAIMGSVLAKAIDNNPNPRVGLLNIGEEEIKGNENVKEAAALIAKSDLNYIGFVEGDDVYIGGVDVVVCDGFVGNVALKTTEGVAKMITHFLREAFSRNWLTRLIGLLSMPVMKAFKKKIDPRRYNGASLLGLKGTVIKSHGGADVIAFSQAIKMACLEAEKSVPERINDQLEAMLGEVE
jgi:glycerol-3-phosphate acyltransferase PlsX